MTVASSPNGIRYAYRFAGVKSRPSIATFRIAVYSDMTVHLCNFGLRATAMSADCINRSTSMCTGSAVWSDTRCFSVMVSSVPVLLKQSVISPVKVHVNVAPLAQSPPLYRPCSNLQLVFAYSLPSSPLQLRGKRELR